MKKISAWWLLATFWLTVTVCVITLAPVRPLVAQNASKGVPAYSYVEINTKASTVVKNGPGVLHNIVVNSVGTAITLQIFDNNACSGTAIAGATAFALPTVPLVLTYDAAFAKGLCIITAGTTMGSITVDYL